MNVHHKMENTFVISLTDRDVCYIFDGQGSKSRAMDNPPDPDLYCDFDLCCDEVIIEDVTR